MAIDPTGIATSLAHQAGGVEPALNADDVEAAKSFEGYLVEMMIQQMRKTIPEGIFQSTGIDMFSGMFDQAVAKEIAAGGGLGLAEAMAAQMNGATPESLTMPIEPGISVGSAMNESPFARGSNPIEGGVMTSGYGRRRDPFTGESRMHRAVDIAAPMGTPIQTLAPGVITMAETNGNYGQVVMVDHGDGWKSLYAHCDRMDVQVGDTVDGGAQLGTVGSSGRSTGPHLHLEIRHHGERVDPTNVLGSSANMER